MRKLIFILVFTFYLLINHYSIVIAQTGWFLQTCPTTKNLRDIFFINSQTGWACGDSGRIIKTTNGGINWTLKTTPTNLTLLAIRFSDSNYGYAVGGDNDQNPFCMYPNVVIKTTNGGENWVFPQTQNQPWKIYYDVAVINKDTAFVTYAGSDNTCSNSAGGSYRTFDGGNSWTQFGGGWIKGISFINSSTGWIVNYDEGGLTYHIYSLYKTTNTGINWNLIYRDSLQSNPGKIRFIDNNNGYCIKSMLRKTTDGGVNWQKVDSATTLSIKSFAPVNKDTLWILKSYNVLRTNNSGVNWIQQLTVGVNLNTIYFVDKNTGWIVGNSGIIFKTTNGGISSPLDTLYTRYFPLNIGNVFVYDWVYSGGGGGTYKLKITKDTIINGKRYYSLSNKFPAFPGTNLVRIDSVNSNIYTYVGSGGCGYNPQEILVDSLKSRINDTSHTCLSSPENLRKCTDTNTLNIFGYQIPTKGFSEVLILSPTPKRFGKNFGLINASFGDPYPTNYTLKGCVINGVVYGDTTAPVTLFSISGTVRYTDNNQPVTSGVVKAIKLNKNDASIIVYDTALIQSNGTYILPNVPQDSIYIGLYPNSGTTPDYIISYYPSATDWHQATGLYPTSNLTNIDLGAIRLQGTTASNSVNGKVLRLTNSMIGNLKDAVLYAKNGNAFVRCSTSDVSGVYHLPSLPTGNLKIIVNRLGFSNDSTTVNVTPTSNIDSINFNLFNNYTGIKPITGEVPTDFKLYQNYPNPFNPVTKIKFDVATYSVGQTFLSVYDLLGREIVTLVNEKLNPGTYEVTFDGSKYASGVYFYQLRTGDFVNTKRLVMIK